MLINHNMDVQYQRFMYRWRVKYCSDHLSLWNVVLYRLFSNIVVTTYGLQIDDISPNAQDSGLSKTKEKNSKAKLGAKLEKH